MDAYNNRVFEARIAQIRYDPRITNGVVTYTTLLKVENSDRVLRPGMTASVRIVAKSISDTLMVPNAALRFTPPKETDLSANSTGLLHNIMKNAKADEQSTELKPNDIGKPRVWSLIKGQLIPVSVCTGLSDGVHTAIAEGDLKEGMLVAVEVLNSD